MDSFSKILDDSERALVINQWRLSILLVMIFVGFGASSGFSQSYAMSKQVNVVHAEPAFYPRISRIDGISGIVVLKVAISSSGKVESVTLLYGDKRLAEAGIESAKKWTFRVGVSSEIVIFDFQLTKEVCEGMSQIPCTSTFTFRPPNIGIVKTQRMGISIDGN